MAQNESININFTGGIVSPGYLKEVLTIAAEAKVEHARFGLRQQLMLDVPAKSYSAFTKACLQKSIQFDKKKEASPNIVSSYPAAGIFTTETWLREGVYKDVFDLFDYTPQLKINICDSSQSLIPFFTGHLNWISSASPHFWYLYIRFPKTQKIFCWKELVYTNDLPLISKQIEDLLLNEEQKIDLDEDTEGSQLYKKVKASGTYVSKPIVKELILPKFSLPYYEGFNRSDNSIWLGIYRRDELFPVDFLIDACTICMETKIGQLYTTSWKSIIIKGIEPEHRRMWRHVLGKYRINVRHAANELNWQIEDLNEDGLTIKRHIIRYFDKEDVRTYGLSFAVQTKPSSSMFGSVIIRKQQVKNPHRLKALDRFDILYTKDFNPNSSHVEVFRENVEKEYLGTYLVSICKFFYEHESSERIIQLPISPAIHNKTTPPAIKTIQQCKHCFTVYDAAVGDSENGIAPGTPFDKLPSNYCCPLCEAGKEDFIAVNESEFKLQAH